MSDPKMQDLEKQREEELTPEQAEEAQGGVIAVSHSIISSEELRPGASFVNAGGNF